METGLLVFIGIILLALVDFLNKLAASTGINPAVGSLIFGIAAFVPPVFWIAVQKITHTPMPIPQKGVLLAIAAGLFIGLMDIVWYKIFQTQYISLSVSIMRTSSIALVIIMGVVFLKEEVDIQSIAGFVLTIVGVFLMLMKK